MVSPGLEPLLRDELEQLGIRGTVTAGGVECRGPIELLWQIHQRSRLAESVRLRLRPFRARDFAELEAGLRRLPFHAYLKKGEVCRVSVTCHQSRLFHTKAVAERTLRIAGECGTSRHIPEQQTQVESEPESENVIPQKIFVRIERDIVQVSMDASGERLHRRGYRTHVVSAPLRETLAAAAIRLLSTLPHAHDIRSIWDPFCGSGTMLCEWLLAKTDPVIRQCRPYAYEAWPIHDVVAYQQWQQTPVPKSDATEIGCAFGSDNDPKAIAAARNNLALANVGAKSQLIAADFRAAAEHIPNQCAVLTNLPYGIRLQDREQASRLFFELDRLLQQRRDLRPVVALNALSPPSNVRGNWQPLATFANGGLRVTAWSIR